MQKIPYCKVDCDGHELDYLRAVVAGGWLTTAGRTQEFERRFAAAVGARHALAVNSCTAALHLAAEALGLGRGDRVFVPDMTFTATAEVLRYLGADPILVDVEAGTNLLTPALLDAAARRHPGAKAVMIVHYGGQAAQMDDEDGREGLRTVCARHGLQMIEDAAHAFPSRRNGRPVGALGATTCFSFYANKTITTGEGGMLVTDDDALARRVKVMRLHGINRDIWDRFTADKPAWEYDVIAPGFKYNLPDLNAAVGLAQLERAEEFRQGRQRCALRYLARLAGHPGLEMPVLQVAAEDHAWHIFPIVLKPGGPVSRNRCIELLGERGIGTSVHYKPLHRMTYYVETYGVRPEDYPQAERTWQGCLSLPLFPSLRDDEVDYVCAALEEILDPAHHHVSEPAPA